MERIDARGQACPLPVVRAKKALSAMGEGSLEVLVDNETAARNLEALARALKCASESERRGGTEFAVRIAKGAEVAGADAAASSAGDAAERGPASARGGRVAVVSSETMGSGDDGLGRTLMKGFLFALTQLDDPPEAVLLYNGGVKWACEGSEALDDLRALAGAGADVLSCGTCLSHYGLTERLAVGEPTNMYDIVERQMSARVVVRP
ncbi:sulfurtransferase-like selenium metabolism protein YedF [Gordonibacter sp. An230]|uniref:sulfurtransferase-like selenium metabolism protein YedF n=1 Tax=Gordonibacter sp. An230 TaxID=1965592 RepID=UPI000B39BA66|nr:sulfurtransferase-like selenium metabolism protein YedF [Gordonibacter sp. An230]OUO88897.1 sulfurtransferase-like selenium metabolism protein YedF [Gordonibacter sp. An230]